MVLKIMDFQKSIMSLSVTSPSLYSTDVEKPMTIKLEPELSTDNQSIAQSSIKNQNNSM